MLKTRTNSEAVLSAFTGLESLGLKCVARGHRFRSNLMLTKTCHFLEARPLLIEQT